ncbi:hypothetical protein BRADI_3g28312v3 [Brachypodium distachyon]|uniref:Uncharacterized protein n=1 Tax=Brachypodium distachyon TaxID=15368 RepID=A0A2K2CZQ3_BRADI|nr:hypothetical protein BRADI_3g28312v3 [Brachypodium distachyon]
MLVPQWLQSSLLAGDYIGNCCQVLRVMVCMGGSSITMHWTAHISHIKD